MKNPNQYKFAKPRKCKQNRENKSRADYFPFYRKIRLDFCVDIFSMFGSTTTVCNILLAFLKRFKQKLSKNMRK